MVETAAALIIKQRFQRLADTLGVEVARQILALFLEKAPADVAQISQAASKGNLRELANAAHSLRGSLLNVGALELADTCARIEQEAAGGRLEASRVQALESEFRLTLSAFKDTILA